MKRLNCLIAIILLFFLVPKATFAQQSGISITPSFIQLDLSREQPQTEISYTNNTDHPVRLHVTAKDFSAFDEQGRFDFLEGQDAKNYHYSLSSWIHFETSDISLNAHETKTIGISIDKNNITIGGHYASILTEIQEQTSSGQVAVHAVAATLLFVRTGTSNEREEASFSDVTLQQQFFAFPDRISIRFQNTGNVQLTPYGLVTIQDSFGKTVASNIFNDASAITLPESIRKYSTTIVAPNQFIFPGIYTIKIALHFGEKNNHITTTKQFFTLGNSLPYIIVCIIAGMIFLRIMRGKIKFLNR